MDYLDPSRYHQALSFDWYIVDIHIEVLQFSPFLSWLVKKKKSQSKGKTIQSSDEGEVFDLNVSGSSSDSAASTGVCGSRPQAAPAVAVEPAVINPIGPTPPTVPVNADATRLLAPPTTGSNRSPQAQDTAYFYLKRDIAIKGVMTSRKVCRLCL